MSSHRTTYRLARLAGRYPFQRRYATIPSDKIRIVEVGPRDGLQNEKNTIPVSTKIELVRRLATTGLQTIEAGSFVSPKWTPQMANSSEILENIFRQRPASDVPITYQWLVPNTKGLDNMLAVYGHQKSVSTNAPPTPPATPPPENDRGPALNTSSEDPNAMPTDTSSATTINDSEPALDTSPQDPNPMPTSAAPPAQPLPPHEISLFTAATETFTQKNTNCSIAESLDRFRPIFSRAKDANIPVRAYISVALGCPYEGPDIDPHKVAELAVTLLEMGAYEISVADTTGQGTATKTKKLLKTLAAAGIANEDLALHFHDTYGQALVNAVVGLEHGVRTFDAAVAGLGGCPYSPGATGNVSSEDLVWMCEALAPGSTGVEVERLAEVGEWISGEVGRRNESRAGKAVLARLKRGGV